MAQQAVAAPVGDLAAKLRAELAYRGIAKYKFAAMIGMHPMHFARRLNGHVPITPELAERIERALAKAVSDDSP